jgi:hypothetical protein
MKSHFRSAPTAILMMLATAGLVRSAESTFSLTITGPSALTVGSELKLIVDLKNTSSHSLPMTNHGPEGPGQEGLYLEVRDSRRKVVPLTEHYRRVQKEGQDGSFVMFTVPPGGTNRSTVVVDHLYELSTPGKYRIWVQRTIGGDTVRSNTITVTVK